MKPTHNSCNLATVVFILIFSFITLRVIFSEFGYNLSEVTSKIVKTDAKLNVTLWRIPPIWNWK